jgi:mitogen-activated protein kinase organizer 1
MELFSKFDCKQKAVRNVRFNKDGNYCVTCGADKTVKLWNPYKQLLLQTYSGHSQEVIDADTSYDHSFLCSGSVDKAVFYTDVATAKIISKYRGHVGRVNCVRFNPDESNLIISGSIDGSVKIWDLRARSYEPLQEIDDCKDSVSYIHMNQRQILVSCLDKQVKLKKNKNK